MFKIQDKLKSRRLDYLLVLLKKKEVSGGRRTEDSIGYEIVTLDQTLG